MQALGSSLQKPQWDNLTDDEPHPGLTGLNATVNALESWELVSGTRWPPQILESLYLVPSDLLKLLRACIWCQAAAWFCALPSPKAVLEVLRQARKRIWLGEGGSPQNSVCFDYCSHPVHLGHFMAVCKGVPWISRSTVSIVVWWRNWGPEGRRCLTNQ